MSQWGEPPSPPEMEPKRRTGLVIGGLVASVALIAGGAATAVFMGSQDDDSDSAAAPRWTAVDQTTTEESVARTSESGGVTETVTVTPEPEETATPEESPESSESSESAGASGDGPACDGRAVLIVNSVMENSPSFQQEVDSARQAFPGAELLDPGHCPSLRASVDGVPVHPLIVDYGRDLEAMCDAATAAPGTNGRLLNDDTSYSSPC